MTKQVVPQLPAANDYVALARTRLRDLTGSDAIVGPAAATPGAAEQSDGEKAAALLKAALTLTLILTLTLALTLPLTLTLTLTLTRRGSRASPGTAG